MDPTTVASATSVLTYLGLGKYAAGLLSLALAIVAILSHIMPYVPVATAASPAWYRGLYTILRFASGLYLKASPTPNAQAVAKATGVPPAVPAVLLAFGLALSLSACSSADVQTGLLVGQSLAQNALTVYEASPRKNATIAAVATDLVNAEPALVGSYSSTATTKANALALAVTAVQQIAADDPKPAIVQAAPLVLAGLAAAQGGTAASPAQLVAVGTMVTTWLLDKALQS